jgi:cyclophilin family peptidyl-prolyl cis-trans isomerase/HEAT repeat protein
MKASFAVAVALIVAPSSSSPGRQPSTVPVAVANAERAWAGADTLLPLARSADAAVAAAAIRALGRLEDRTLIPALLELGGSSSSDIRDAAADAIAQTLAHADPKSDPSLTARAAERLLSRGQWRALGRIAFSSAREAAAVEALLAGVLDDTEAGLENRPTRDAAATAIESLVRRNAKLSGFAMRPDTVARLAAAVKGTHENDGPHVRLYALWTLLDGGAITADALQAGLEDSDAQVRRVAVQALDAETVPAIDDARAKRLRHAIADPSMLVRIEAIRVYAKRSAASQGCGPLLDALHDRAQHVVNTALDALGTACPGDADVTARLAAEARTPPTAGSWHRAAHAFVALARRDPSRARVATGAFATHPVWEVRMYAARAAGAMKDEHTLARLAKDSSANVRSTALPLLRELVGARADAAIVSALSLTDNQVLRTAATLLAKAPPSHAFYKPLVSALLRLSRLEHETTRDARLPLLDAIAVHGTRDDAADLEPLLTDIDPRVAERTTTLLGGWGVKAVARPRPVVHSAAPDVADLSRCVAVQMAGGRVMRLRPDWAAAPVTVGRFLKLALDDHYYDGLTFHRVEPNFVIQGGSPGANEYSSSLRTFLRDEIGLPNVRGAVGLSTRGLNTGDGQIYVMLADAPRLDGSYTIFAHVFDADMDSLDAIQEGDRLARVVPAACS